ncbi:MAG: hypothetical protein ACOYXR_15335 [Nitrospirota bacterium]
MIRALVAFVLVLGAAHAAWAGPRDGQWWLAAPESFRLGYVAGYLAGRDEQATRWGALANDTAAQLPEEARSQIEPVLDALRESDKAFADVTYAQLVEQLDGFYRPEKNRRIPLEQALTVVRQALAGVDQPYLYCQVEYFRLAHNSEIPMKERLEALGKKAAECAEMSPHKDLGPEGGVDERYGLPEGHPTTE